MAVRSVTIALFVTASRMLRSGVSVKRIGVRTAIVAATLGALALPSAAIAQNAATPPLAKGSCSMAAGSGWSTNPTPLKPWAANRRRRHDVRCLYRHQPAPARFLASPRHVPSGGCSRSTDVACISDRSGLLVGGYQVRGQSRFTGFTDQHGVFRSLRGPSATLGTLPQCGNDGGRVAGFYITQIGHMSVTRGFRFTPGTLSGAASERGQRGPGVLQAPVSPRLGRP